MPISTGSVTSQLDKLSLQVIIAVVLLLDIPSLTRFCSFSHCIMQLVNSVRQYTSIIDHCPDIIRAIMSIQADALHCATLYRTLSTTRCSICNCFGN